MCQLSRIDPGTSCFHGCWVCTTCSSEGIKERLVWYGTPAPFPNTRVLITMVRIQGLDNLLTLCPAQILMVFVKCLFKLSIFSPGQCPCSCSCMNFAMVIQQTTFHRSFFPVVDVKFSTLKFASNISTVKAYFFPKLLSLPTNNFQNL